MILASVPDDKLDFTRLPQAAGLSKPATSRALDTLEYRGITRRIRNKEDSKRVFLSLTPKGREMADRIMDCARPSGGG